MASRRWIIALLLSVALIAFWLTSRFAHEESECAMCKQRLVGISSALRNYVRNHGALPPAYVADEDGRPLNSWRTLIVSYWWYHFDESGVDLQKSWNGPENNLLRFEHQHNREYCCGAQRDPRRPALTTYVAIIGPNTMWPGDRPATPAADGSDDDKVLLIEVLNSDILWMEPRDLTLDEALDRFNPTSGLGIGSPHRRGINYVTVGGQGRTLDRNIDRDALRRLIVRDDANLESSTRSER